MKKIEELRKELNMSLKEFSEYYEIPYNTVRQWEKGERTPPNYVIKLLNKVINLKAKGEQIIIDINKANLK